MVTASSFTPSPSSELRSYVESQSGQLVSRCYQCGKCTAGCPAAYTMDLGPRKVMRAIQLGLRDEVMSSSTIWICVYCHTCSSRCPREIDIAQVMESLRTLAVTEGGKRAEKDIQLFHRLFLLLVQRWGRIHELGLGALYNIMGVHPLANMNKLPGMLARGKLAILPPRVKGTSEIRKLFNKVKEVEKVK